MTTATRFLFDVSFDDPEEPAVVVEESKEEAPVEEVVEAAPTFSEEELDAARTEAFAAGKEEAARELAESQERRVADALALIGERMEGLFQAQKEAAAESQANAAAIAVAISRKIFPELNRRHALDEIARLVEQSLARVIDESRIVIHVSPDLRDSLATRLEELQRKSGFDGKLVLVAGPDTALGDCRLEWAEGGAERGTTALWQQIDEVIEGYLDATGIADTEEPGPAPPQFAEEPVPTGDEPSAGGA